MQKWQDRLQAKEDELAAHGKAHEAAQEEHGRRVRELADERKAHEADVAERRRKLEVDESAATASLAAAEEKQRAAEEQQRHVKQQTSDAEARLEQVLLTRSGDFQLQGACS